VEWTTGLDADSPEQAAKLAQEMLRDPDSLANVFDVVEADDDGGVKEGAEWVEVDLDDLEE
jgi:hypothetical protein